MAERTPSYVVMFSGGIASAYLAHLVIEREGRDNTVLFFTDTLWEDEDNYRFMREVSEHLHLPITYQADGRTPKQVFWDRRLLKRHDTAPCSTELKMKQTVIYVETQRTKGIEPILYFGIERTEAQRAQRLEHNYSHNCLEAVECRFPLIDLGVSKSDMLRIIEQEWGIRKPRMYELGFDHANCGGRCVKAGGQHYRNLLRVWPERFAEVEDMERRFNEEINTYTLLRRKRKPYTLRELREAVEAQVEIEFEDENMPCTCIF